MVRITLLLLDFSFRQLRCHRLKKTSVDRWLCDPFFQRVCLFHVAAASHGNRVLSNRDRAYSQVLSNSSSEHRTVDKVEDP